jgi:DNA-directed RNA polymerase subunit RPC12/RpoP
MDDDWTAEYKFTCSNCDNEVVIADVDEQEAFTTLCMNYPWTMAIETNGIVCPICSMDRWRRERGNADVTLRGTPLELDPPEQEDEFYLEGWEAYEWGAPAQENPYDLGTERFQDWHRGWYEAGEQHRSRS